MLNDFSEWAIKLSEIAKLRGFDAQVIIREGYFTKISIDSDIYVSEIVIWDNHNLCEAGIIEVTSNKYVYFISCEYNHGTDFSDFLSVLGLPLIKL